VVGYLFIAGFPTILMVYDTIGDSAVDWAGKTYLEILETTEQDGSILVVPVGSIEQHGYHLPVCTDTLLADAVATTGAEAVADEMPVLVAPPVYPGFSPHHMSFGGTITLEFRHALSLLENIVETALTNGFSAVLLLNGHGGNIPLIGAATSTIGVNNPDVSVYGITYFQLADPFIDDIRESESGGMGHAGEFETSLLLHLRPDLVDKTELEGTYLNDPYDFTLNDMFEGGPLSVYPPFETYSESGTIGDPKLATAEKGEELLDALQEELAALLRVVHEENM